MVHALPADEPCVNVYFPPPANPRRRGRVLTAADENPPPAAGSEGRYGVGSPTGAEHGLIGAAGNVDRSASLKERGEASLPDFPEDGVSRLQRWEPGTYCVQPPYLEETLTPVEERERWPPGSG